MKSSLFLFIFYLSFAGCDSPCNTPITAIPFGFDISDSAKDDIFSQQYLGNFPRDSVKIYYKDKYGFINTDSIVISNFAGGKNNVFSVISNDILAQSVSGIKTFYFKRKNNVVDTIYFDEQIESGHCHIYKLYSFKYNGIDISKNGHAVVVKQ